MASLAEIKDFEDATDISWHLLQQFHAKEIIEDALPHVHG